MDEAHDNHNMAFWFATITGLVGLILLTFVDTDMAKRDNAKYLERERKVLYESFGGD